MRLCLLPISTRRTLIYAKRATVAATEPQTLVEKGTARAAKLWSDWEKKDSGWQKKLVDYGNMALKRIPYEEWGLKSIPPLSAAAKEKVLSEKQPPVEVSFPSSFIPEEKVPEVLRILGTEREALHRKRMIYSIIGMPICIPFALVPVLPNIPFFYLTYRAWSHWRALSGSRHIQFLLENNLVIAKPSKIMDELYAKTNSEDTQVNSAVNQASEDSESKDAESKDAESKDAESMLLTTPSAKVISEALEIPELEMELDRAIWQVQTALEEQKKAKEEKESLGKAEPDSQSKPGDKEG